MAINRAAEAGAENMAQCPYLKGMSTAPPQGYKLKADEPITFYSNVACPWAQRTWLALEEANAEYMLEELDLQNKPAWYKDINPLTKVPALKYGEDVIYESAVTTEFVADVFPQMELVPENAIKRAKLRLFVDRFMNLVTPAWYEFMRKSAEDAAKTFLAGVENFQPFLDDVGPFWGHSKRFTLAELLVAPFIVRLYFAGANGMLGDAYTILTTDAKYHKFHGWASLVISSDSVKKTFDTQKNLKVIKEKSAGARGKNGN